MFLGSWVEVDMASVYQTATSNVVDGSYLWLVPAACRAQGADWGPCSVTSFVGRETAPHWLPWRKKAEPTASFGILLS